MRKWGNRKRRTLSYPKRDWFRQYKALAALEPYHVLLESGQGGRYSIIGLTPAGIIQAKENQQYRECLKKAAALWKAKEMSEAEKLLRV